MRLRTRVTGLRRCGSCYEIELPEGVIQAKVVVNAAGAEAGTLAQMLGVSLPVQGFPIQVSVTEPVEPLVSHLVYYAREKLTLKQTLLGTILIGGGWPARQDAWGRPVADPRSLATNLQVALEVVPRLAPVNVVRTWAAIVNGTEDWRPLLGEVPGLPGFFLCYVPWMGFTAGPAAGRIVASLIQQRTPPLDVDYLAFAPS